MKKLLFIVALTLLKQSMTYSMETNVLALLDLSKYPNLRQRTSNLPEGLRELDLDDALGYLFLQDPDGLHLSSDLCKARCHLAEKLGKGEDIKQPMSFHRLISSLTDDVFLELCQIPYISEFKIIMLKLILAERADDKDKIENLKYISNKLDTDTVVRSLRKKIDFAQSSLMHDKR